MAMSSFLKNSILDTYLATVYVSLHTADPGDNGASEVVGGSYARQAVAFDVAASGATTNSAVEEYPGMPAVTVTHIGIWDAVSAGNFLWGAALSSSQAVGAGNTFRFAAGAIDPSIS